MVAEPTKTPLSNRIVSQVTVFGYTLSLFRELTKVPLRNQHVLSTIWFLELTVVLRLKVHWKCETTSTCSTTRKLAWRSITNGPWHWTSGRNLKFCTDLELQYHRTSQDLLYGSLSSRWYWDSRSIGNVRQRPLVQRRGNWPWEASPMSLSAFHPLLYLALLYWTTIHKIKVII